MSVTLIKRSVAHELRNRNISDRRKASITARAVDQLTVRNNTVTTVDGGTLADWVSHQISTVGGFSVSDFASLSPVARLQIARQEGF